MLERARSSTSLKIDRASVANPTNFRKKPERRRARFEFLPGDADNEYALPGHVERSEDVVPKAGVGAPLDQWVPPGSPG